MNMYFNMSHGLDCDNRLMTILCHDLYHNNTYRGYKCSTVDSVRIGNGLRFPDLLIVDSERNPILVVEGTSPSNDRVKCNQKWLLYSKKGFSNKSKLTWLEVRGCCITDLSVGKNATH